MENTAVGKLREGQRLMMTDAAIKQGLIGRAKSTTGIFREVSVRGLIRVQRDGLTGVDLYSPMAWNLES